MFAQLFDNRGAAPPLPKQDRLEIARTAQDMTTRWPVWGPGESALLRTRKPEIILRFNSTVGALD